MLPKEDSIAALISNGVDRAKLGEARTVYEEIRAAEAPISEKSHYALGWIIYYALHQENDKDIQWRKRLLAEYLQLHTPRPHKLHSMVLNEAIRLRDDAVKAGGYPRPRDFDPKNSFSIVRFLPLWDTANLRPGDWNRHQLNDKNLSSTVEKLITAYVSEIEETGMQPSEKFIEMIDNAMLQYRDSFNLLCQRATLCSLAGDTDTAVRLLKSAILLAPGKFHIWARLASLIDIDKDPQLKMALLARALAAPGKPEFKGRIRLELAAIWLARNCFSHAAWELRKVKHLYESKQWHLPKQYAAVMEKMPEAAEPADPTSSYKASCQNADDFIYTSLPETATKKTYHKNPQPAGSVPSKWKRSSEYSWRVTDEAGNDYWFQPGRFGIDPTLPLGTPVLIRHLDGRLMYAKLPD